MPWTRNRAEMPGAWSTSTLTTLSFPANSLAAEPVALEFSLVKPLLARPLFQLPLEPGLLLFEARQFLGGASPCLGEGCLFTALLLCDPGDLGLPGALV